MARPDDKPRPVPARRPVARAEDVYTPPPHRPADAWRQVPPAERIIAWYEEKHQRRLPRTDSYVIGHTVYARINHGRWVADCPCGSAQAVTPDDPRMFCPDCGAGWFTLIFPDNAAPAEASVADELPHLQNWWHPDDTTAWDRPHPEPPATKPQLDALLADTPRL